MRSNGVRAVGILLATGLALAGDVLFVSLRNNGVEFVDVGDFRHPAHIDVFKTPESQSVAYSDGWLYSGEWGVGEITVFDVHDMAGIKKFGMVPLKGYGDGVDVRGKLLFAATGHHRKDASKSKEENDGLGHGLEMFDISDPEKPAFPASTPADSRTTPVPSAATGCFG